MQKRQAIVCAVALGVILLPLILNNRYLLHVGITAGVYLMLVLGLFIVSGITGQLNMGQAGIWAIGAYSYAIMVTKFDWPFLAAAAFAVAFTTMFSLLIGLPALKVSGIYFAMVTVGLGEIIRIVLLNWRELSGGGMGIRNIPKPAFLGITVRTPAQFYILTVLLALLCFVVTLKLLKSNVGLTLKAIGSNETVTRALGVNAFHMKLVALALSSAYAGVAGVIFAGYYGFLHPDAFTSAQSFFLVQMLVIGGMHSLAGITVMTPILTYSLEYLRALGEYQMIAYAAILILFLVFCPQGVGGLVESYMRSSNRPQVSPESYAASRGGTGDA